MKMNKLVKGLLVGFIALQMVGCEEAKEVENLNIQDNNPLIEQAKDLQEELEANDEYNEAIKNYIASDGQDQEALRDAVGVALDKAKETKEVEKDPGVAQDYGYKCCLCGIELHNYEQDPDAPADEQYCETCFYEARYCQDCGRKLGFCECDVVENAKCGDCGACVELCECDATEEAICDNCNGKCVPYYSEDGITVCSEWCFQEMQNRIANEGMPYEAVCGKCGHHVRDVLYNENLGMEVCEDCWQ